MSGTEGREDEFGGITGILVSEMRYLTWLCFGMFMKIQLDINWLRGQKTTLFVVIGGF